MDKKESLLQQKIKAEKEIAQLQNQQKIILNKQRDLERHARNHRLIVHGAILEGVFPFTTSMLATLPLPPFRFLCPPY